MVGGCEVLWKWNGAAKNLGVAEALMAVRVAFKLQTLNCCVSNGLMDSFIEALGLVQS